MLPLIVMHTGRDTSRHRRRYLFNAAYFDYGASAKYFSRLQAPLLSADTLHHQAATAPSQVTSKTRAIDYYSFSY